MYTLYRQQAVPLIFSVTIVQTVNIPGGYGIYIYFFTETVLFELTYRDALRLLISLLFLFIFALSSLFPNFESFLYLLQCLQSTTVFHLMLHTQLTNTPPSHNLINQYNIVGII